MSKSVDRFGVFELPMELLQNVHEVQVRLPAEEVVELKLVEVDLDGNNPVWQARPALLLHLQCTACGLTAVQWAAL